MRIVVLGFALVALLLPISAASAIEVNDPQPRLPDSPLLLSAYGLSGSTAESPDFVELYNDSSSVIKLNDWQMEYSWSLTATAPPNTLTLDTLKFPLVTKQSVDEPDIYLKPKQYTVLSFGSSVPTARLAATAIAGNPSTFISSISLRNDNYKPYQKLLTKAQPGAWFLGETTTGFTSTGTYYQFPSDKIRTVFSLYDGGLYQLGVDAPRSFPLTPIEIVANPRSCAPTESDAACLEYVKFYNGTTIPIDFAGTALHIGTQSSSSFVPLSGILKPGEYALFSHTSSGAPIEITNSGGYVWLSDTYGITQFENTVVEYADASSSTKKGQSWALIDGLWQWGLVSPSGANQKLPQITDDAEPGVNSLTPCRSDQYRNPETNRCKLIATSTTSLAACAPNQYRNPETNRCRSITSSTSSLTPCSAGQYRNPETNRCKAIATTASALTPCKPGYERNPDTNRCRKATVASIPSAVGAVTSGGGSSSQSIGWVAFAAVALLAVGYGVWEWRGEIAGLFGRVVSLLKR